MLRPYRIAQGLLVLSLPLVFAAPTWAQVREDNAVTTSTAALNEIMAIPLKGIPQSLLADAEAIAIVPNVVKGSFVVGVRHGRGVVLVREEGAGWRAPQFVSLTGGSVGFQIGVQSTDVILVFKSRKSVEGLLRGKFTIGADAAAAAGPVGRQAAAATDERLQAEIYSYSRSRGLFAGVSLDGSVLEIDHTANAVYYRGTGLSPDGLAVAADARLPDSAAVLMRNVAAYSAPVAGPDVREGTVIAEEPLIAEGETIQGVPQLLPPEHLPQPAPAMAPASELRPRLAAVSMNLQKIVDENWQRYLSLPAEVYAGQTHPAPEVIQRALANYEAVAAQQQYGALTSRAEFRSTHELLRQYAASLAARPATLQLPPPPR